MEQKKRNILEFEEMTKKRTEKIGEALRERFEVWKKNHPGSGEETRERVKERLTLIQEREEAAKRIVSMALELIKEKPEEYKGIEGRAKLKAEISERLHSPVDGRYLYEVPKETRVRLLWQVRPPKTRGEKLEEAVSEARVKFTEVGAIPLPEHGLAEGPYRKYIESWIKNNKDLPLLVHIDAYRIAENYIIRNERKLREIGKLV